MPCHHSWTGLAYLHDQCQRYSHGKGLPLILISYCWCLKLTGSLRRSLGTWKVPRFPVWRAWRATKVGTAGRSPGHAGSTRPGVRHCGLWQPLSRALPLPSAPRARRRTAAPPTDPAYLHRSRNHAQESGCSRLATQHQPQIWTGTV